MFDATAQCLEPVYHKMHMKGGDPKVIPKLKELGDRFDTLYYGLERKAAKITNKQWRMIKADLKKIGGVSFQNLDTHFMEICQNLVALGDLFSYMDE